MKTRSNKSTSLLRFAGLFFCLAAGVFLGLPGTIHAAVFTWDGGGGDNNWGTGLNWVGDIATGTTDAFVFDGTTQLSSNNNLGGGGKQGITFASGAGAFTLTGAAFSLAGGSITNNSANVETINFASITLFNGSRTLSAASGNITIGSAIGSNGVYGVTVTSTSSTSVTLSGANTFTGATNISFAGTLSVSSLNSVTTGHVASSNLGAPTTDADGTIGMGNSGNKGTLTYTGTGETTDRIINLAGTTGGATINQSGASGLLKFTSGFTATGNGTKTLTLQGSTAGTGEIAGAIADSTSATNLVKAGSGTWALSGTNTYTGTTTVNVGTLLINGSTSTSSVLTVNSGGTLGGNGTIGGATTVAAGAILSPGNSPGNLTFSSGLTLAGAYKWELAALSTSNPGTDFDTITVTAGNVDITGASMNLTLGGFAPTNVAFWQANQTWTGILNNTGAGTLTGSFAAIDNSSWSALGAFTTSNVGNDVNLVWTAVPEPATWALLAFSLTTVMVLRRRGKFR